MTEQVKVSDRSRSETVGVPWTVFRGPQHRGPIVQLPAHYRISSFCHDGGCVAVARTNDGVEVASTLLPGRKPIPFTADEWSMFVAGVKNGEFDIDMS